MTLVLLALVAGGLAQDPPAREKASGFTFTRPRGWSRQELPQQNAVALMPPNVPAGQECSLFVFPGQNGELNSLVFHNQLFQSITQGSQVNGEIDRGYRGDFQFSHARIVNAQGLKGWIVLYTTKSDTRLEALLFVAGSEELYKAHRFAVERMLSTIEFPGARPPPPGGPEWTPAPVPDQGKDVRILGAWLAARMETAFSVDPRAGGVKQTHAMKVIVLFANQVAAKVDAMQTGLIDSTYPAEGLATMNVSNPAALANDRRYGRWSEAGGKIAIQWNQGPASTLRREKEHLKEGEVLWSALRPIDGLRLDGTYARQSEFGRPWSISFKKDGTFESDQVNETMGGKLVNRKFPEAGSGTYEFRKWSLILRFDTGFVQSIHIDFDAGDPGAAKTLLVNGYPFAREGPATSSAPPPAAAREK